jgi:hypothetical protein
VGTSNGSVGSPGFAAEAHRQALAVARSPFAAEDQAFIEAVSGLLSDPT